MKRDRYYLFTSELHETVRLDFTKKTIKRFLELWQANSSYERMCKTLRITPTELALIAIDLDYTGQLPEREGGFWGLEDEDEEG